MQRTNLQVDTGDGVIIADISWVLRRTKNIVAWSIGC